MPKRFSKRKLQVVNTKTNRPVHPQPTSSSSETYNPYAVIVPSTSVFLLELTVNTCRKKERPPTTLVAILNVRARSRGHASTNQTFFASERERKTGSPKPTNLVPRGCIPRGGIEARPGTEKRCSHNLQSGPVKTWTAVFVIINIPIDDQLI